MLNELYDLAQCLQAAHVSTDSWHRHFKPCPRGYPTYMALLDAESQIAGLEHVIDAERITSIRKWGAENGVSFPGLNIQPLYEVIDEDAKRLAAGFRRSLESKSPPNAEEVVDGINGLIRVSRPLWSESRAAKIEKSLTFHAQKLLAELGPPPAEYRAIAELIARANRLDANLLRVELQTTLTSTISLSPATTSAFFDVLFFFTGRTPKNVSLILELADRSRFEYPANHKAVQDWMNTRLQSTTGADTRDCVGSDAESRDAFAGAATNLGDTFPSARLPLLGDVILRAMSSESLCQRRYGFADSASCPVGGTARQEMKDALEWIGNLDRRNKTWSDISALTGKAAVLFAYPTQAPSLAPELAGLIAGLDSDTDPDGVRFETRAQRVSYALRGETENRGSGEIRVFVLLRADRARTKVLSNRRFATTHFLDSAERWQRDAHNIPPVKIRQFGENREVTAAWANPLTPFPAELVWCANTTWTHAGTHAEQVQGCDISDGLTLLLEQGPALNTVAIRTLRTVVSNSLNLLLAMGHAPHRVRVHQLGQTYRTQSLLLPGILGLLLAKLGRERGVYMKGPPFLVGRLLSLTDQLHVQYCHGVRHGNIPPQLVGNALMTTALEQPTKALALLWQRIRPYQAWANTVREGENIGLAKYLLGEIGRVSADLAQSALPVSCNDLDKAEMLLGYLAHSAKEKNTETQSSTNTEGAHA